MRIYSNSLDNSGRRAFVYRLKYPSHRETGFKCQSSISCGRKLSCYSDRPRTWDHEGIFLGDKHQGPIGNRDQGWVNWNLSTHWAAFLCQLCTSKSCYHLVRIESYMPAWRLWVALPLGLKRARLDCSLRNICSMALVSIRKRIDSASGSWKDSYSLFEPQSRAPYYR